MAAMQWDESLSVGIDLVDEQHKQWIERINAVSAAIEHGQGPDEIQRTLEFLIDYTDLHFTTEEKHMRRHDYPGIELHRSKHEELKKTLGDLVADFEEEGATQVLAHAIDTFLGNWLAKHIREVDMQFGSFVKERGIVVAEES